MDAEGEVLLLVGLPYAALDARRMAAEHLPARNLVSTLFELNAATGPTDAESPLRNLGHWLGGLGTHAEAIRAEYAEWLATTTPTWFSPEQAAALVERTTGTGKPEETEEGMAFSVMEDNVRRRIRRAARTGRREGHTDGRREGLASGLEHERKLRRVLAARRFGDGTAGRLAPLLAALGDPEELERIGEWIVDCTDGEELIARFDNGADGGG